MASLKTFALFYFAGLVLVVVHVLKTDAQRHRPPLCTQQFSLANYACANLPFMPLSSALASSSLPPLSSTASSTPPSPPPSPPVDPPATTTATPPPPPTLRGRRGGGHRRHRRGRRHHHNDEDDNADDDDDDDDDNDNYDDAPAVTPAEESCCRWLKEMDSECVCDVLVRLPPFLAKPSHVYSVHVYDGCIVTFSCSGRIVP